MSEIIPPHNGILGYLETREQFGIKPSAEAQRGLHVWRLALEEVLDISLDEFISPTTDDSGAEGTTPKLSREYRRVTKGDLSGRVRESGFNPFSSNI